MLAFGTSVMWGNGLKQADTSRYGVADSVAAQTARPARLTTLCSFGGIACRRRSLERQWRRISRNRLAT